MTRRATATLHIQLDQQSGASLQEQLHDGIRRAIREGHIPPNTRLPSSRALAAELGVSRTTTQMALEQLQAEGYLTTRHGSGTFVASEPPDQRPRAPSPMPRVQWTTASSLSRRGAAIAAAVPAARRLAGPPRAFRLGVPALELFPVRTWARLASRRVMTATSTQLDYGRAGGLKALREAIADHVQTARGTRCDADQVYVVSGAQRGLDLLCRVILDPGDRALMEEPGYPGAWNALVGAGASIEPVPVDGDGMDIDACAGTSARLAYVTPAHQFPLGVAMSLPRRFALLRWATAAKAWIVEDDYDSEFRYAAQPVPCLHGLDGGGRVIYVGTFSKSLFPALRLGFLIVPPALLDRLLAARWPAGDPQPPFLDQAILADFMAGGHFARHVSRMRAAYRERLEALAAAADRYCAGALELRPVRTGIHAVADVVGVDANRVFEEAMARGVEVMPLSAYVLGSAPADNALVLGFGAVSPEAVTTGMAALAEAIDAAGQRPTLGCAAE
jgi:GntR family transcriptional regulator / MocR family aminotransferase